MSETYRPQNIDSSVSLTQLRRITGAGGAKLWHVDPPEAYETIAPHLAPIDGAIT